MKPGRNDPCPCGSGKKYKKCCIPKYDTPVATAQRLSEDRDDPAVERLELLVSKLFPLEESGKTAEKLDVYREIWSVLKKEVLLPGGYRSLAAFQAEKETFSDFEWVIGDYVVDLMNEAIGKEERVRNQLLEEGITVCQEFIELLPESDLETLLNMRKDMAEMHVLKDDFEQAEFIYEQLIAEHPYWTWGYTGLGDMYEMRGRKNGSEEDLEKAVHIWRQGLSRCKDDTDALEERLSEFSENN